MKLESSYSLLHRATIFTCVLFVAGCSGSGSSENAGVNQPDVENLSESIAGNAVLADSTDSGTGIAMSDASNNSSNAQAQAEADTQMAAQTQADAQAAADAQVAAEAQALATTLAETDALAAQAQEQAQAQAEAQEQAQAQAQAQEQAQEQAQAQAQEQAQEQAQVEADVLAAQAEAEIQAAAEALAEQERATIRVNFDITVPVYSSNALRVRVAWGDIDIKADWIFDQSWELSTDFQVDEENPLVVSFFDGNGDLLLARAETILRTESSESQSVQIIAAQFESIQFDDDNDGVSNLAESLAGTDPLIDEMLEPVTASMELFIDKTFRFSWQAVQGANFYRILENEDGSSGFSQIGEDLDSSTLTFNHRVALYRKLNARYIIQACNAAECVDSNELLVSGPLTEAIGYFKSSNSDPNDDFGHSVALNADGTVMAIGAHQEDSIASGVNGFQQDNSADQSGAVYVFARSKGQWQQQAYIKASNPDPNDRFGLAISLSSYGNTLAVGVRNEDSGATGVNGNQSSNESDGSGAVYVYTNTDGVWQQQAYLKASNADSSDAFGSAVSLSGDGNTLAVSATSEDSNATGINGNQRSNSTDDAGAVYVFTRINDIWQQQAYLKASNTERIDLFGTSHGLSADGNTLAVGAPGEDSLATGVNGDQSSNRLDSAGAVYLFERINGNWEQQSYIKASNSDNKDQFGGRLSLSADGETLAVAAKGEGSLATGIDGNQNDDSSMYVGAVYVFQKTSGNWQQQAYVKASNSELADFFGTSVSLSGDGNTMVVGALLEDGGTPGINGNEFDNSQNSSGAAYVYVRNNGIWQQQAYLKPGNPGGDKWFGQSTSITTDGETVAIGAPQDSGSGRGINVEQNIKGSGRSGAVYLY